MSQGLTTVAKNAYGLIERIFPYLFMILAFTIPLVKGVPGIVHVTIVILFVIQMFYRREYRIEAAKYYGIIFFFLAVSAMSLFYSSDINDGLHILKGQCFLLVGIILIERISSTKSARHCLYAYVVGGTILACIGAYQGYFLNVHRPPNINDLQWVWAGNLLMITSLVLLALMTGEKKIAIKVLNALMLIANGIALYFNGTRGVWVALIAIIFMLPLIQPGFRLKTKLIYLISFVIITVVGCNIKYFHERISEAKADLAAYESSKADTSLGARFEMWKTSASMIREHPFLGVGTGSWKTELKKRIEQHRAPGFLGIYGQTHSIYFDALSTRGPLGLVSLLLLIAFPMFYAWKRREPENMLYRNVVIFAAIGFLISGLTDTLILLRLVFMSYVLVTGLGLAVLFRPCHEMIEQQPAE